MPEPTADQRTPQEPVWTLPEVARELRVSVPTLRNWIAAGKLKAIRLPGGTLRVHPTELRRVSGASDD